MKATKTTYQVDGCTEPCWVVGEVKDGTYVRIAPFYHLIGHDTILVTEFLNGSFNSQEELDEEFELLSEWDAIRIAKQHSVYIY